MLNNSNFFYRKIKLSFFSFSIFLENVYKFLAPSCLEIFQLHTQYKILHEGQVTCIQLSVYFFYKYEIHFNNFVIRLCKNSPPPSLLIAYFLEFEKQTFNCKTYVDYLSDEYQYLFYERNIF